MPNYPRMFAYATAAFTLGMILYVFTNLFIPFTQTRDWSGSAAMLGFAAVFGSMSASLARRYVSKTTVTHEFPYTIIPFIVLPTLVITHLKADFAMIADQIVFTLLLTIGAVIGARLGIKAGHKRRADLIGRLLEKERREQEKKERQELPSEV